MNLLTLRPLFDQNPVPAPLKRHDHLLGIQPNPRSNQQRWIDEIVKRNKH